MSWSVSEAKARLSEVLSRARRGPQVIENRGEAVAVVVSKQEFDRLQQLRAEPRPSAMAELLEVTRKLKAEGELELELPPRELEPDRLPSF
jgi:prevent-host-death family protein